MLQELWRLAEREQLIGDPAFEVKSIAWIIELAPDGTMVGGFSGTHQPVPSPPDKKAPKKPREEVKKFTIPRQFNLETGGTRTSGDYAYFLVDKSDYVLGCSLGAKAGQQPEGKPQARQRLFIDKVRDAFESTGEPKLEAVVKFLERVQAEGLPVDMPEKAAPGDLFGFIVWPDLDEFVHDLPAVRDYWRNLCRGESGAPSQDWTCLITGEPMGMPALFPMVKRVPGAQAQSGLVSFNSSAFESYGWKSNANAPVSSRAAQAASVAMNRLLDPAFQRQDGTVLQRRHIRLGPDTVVCFWAAEVSGDELSDGLQAALQADPGGKTGELWRSVWRGKAPAKLNKTKFYAVTLSGAQGRAIVRDWYQSTVGETQESLARYFWELELRPNTFPPKNKPLPPQYALRILQESLTASGKADDFPAKHAADLFAAAINQRVRYPSALLPIALERMRAEAGRKDWIDSYRRDARTALIKAILIRNHEQSHLIEPMNYPDKAPAFLLGCLFACIERMQYLALGDQINANLANRYFAAASSTPLLVFDNILRDCVSHYLKKATRKKKGAAWALNRRIMEIQTVYGEKKRDGYPSRLNPVEQGLFMIGYHTQKGEFLQKKTDQDAEPVDAEAPAQD
jgi:CRISPR-associated protein Csd1